MHDDSTVYILFSAFEVWVTKECVCVGGQVEEIRKMVLKLSALTIDFWARDGNEFVGRITVRSGNWASGFRQNILNIRDGLSPNNTWGHCMHYRREDFVEEVVNGFLNQLMTSRRPTI